MRRRKQNRTKIQKDKFFRKVFYEMKENGTVPEDSRIEDFELVKVKSFGKNNINHIEEIEILVEMLKNSSDDSNGMEFDPNIIALFNDLDIVGDYSDKEWLLGELEQKRDEINEEIGSDFNNLIRKKSDERI